MSPGEAQRALDKLPPGADSHQLEEFRADPLGMMKRYADRYGPVFTLRLGDLGNGPREGLQHNGLWVFLTRKDDIRAMYESTTLVGGAANRIFFGTDEDSVGFVDGPVHKARRAALLPLLSSRRDYRDLIETITSRHVLSWPSPSPRPVFRLLQSLTADVISTVVCGGMPDEIRTDVREDLLLLENADVSPERALAAEQAVKTRLGAYIPQARANIPAVPREHVDLTDELIDQASGPHWRGDALRDELFSLLFTGFSTTANTLSWVLAELRANPGIYAEVIDSLQGVDVVAPAGQSKFEVADTLDAVLLETLRLHPVSALNGVRMTTEATEIAGYRVPPHTVLVHCAYLAQRDEAIFADPEEFKPSRFLGSPVEPYDVAPFGGGHRTCLGRTFALREMRYMLSVILKSLALGPAPIVAARQEGIFMAPEDGVMALVASQ